MEPLVKVEPGDTEDCLVRTDLGSGVTLLTLNRPAVGNALNLELRDRIRREFEQIEDDPDVAAVVLTGSGRTFCSGLDLNEVSEGGGVLSADLDEVRHRQIVPQLGVPVIAAVNGPAITGGWELALGCSFIVASESAWFRDTHAQIGILPGAGMSVRLSRRAGATAGLVLSLTGRKVDADEALRRGLVEVVVPFDDVVTTAVEVARTASQLDPMLVARLLELYRHHDESPGHTSWTVEHLESRRWLLGHQPRLDDSRGPRNGA